MGLFRHPSLVRGIVHTPHGAFAVVRRLVDVPDEIGEALGWESVDGATLSPSESVARELLTTRTTSVDRLNAH